MIIRLVLAALIFGALFLAVNGRPDCTTDALCELKYGDAF